MSRRTVKLPGAHAADWVARCREDLGAVVVAQTARTLTMTLPPAALADLIADCQHYADVMHGEFTDGVDYRPAARRCLASLTRQGIATG